MRLVVHHDGRTASGSASVVSDRRRRDCSSSGSPQRCSVAPVDPTWPGLATSAAAGDTDRGRPGDRWRRTRRPRCGRTRLRRRGRWPGDGRLRPHQPLDGSVRELGGPVGDRRGRRVRAGRDRAPRRRRRGRPLGAAAGIDELDGAALGARAAAKARACSEPDGPGARPLRGGARADRGRGRPRQPRRRRVQRQGGQRARLVRPRRRGAVRPGSVARRRSAGGRASGTTRRARHVAGSSWSTAVAPWP